MRTNAGEKEGGKEGEKGREGADALEHFLGSRSITSWRFGTHQHWYHENSRLLRKHGENGNKYRYESVRVLLTSPFLLLFPQSLSLSFVSLPFFLSLLFSMFSRAYLYIGLFSVAFHVILLATKTARAHVLHSPSFLTFSALARTRRV